MPVLACTLITVTLCISATSTIGLGQSRAATTATPNARLARVTSVMDRTYLRLVGRPGIEITENGSSYGTIGGSMSSELTLEGDEITGTFVLHAHGGVITGNTMAHVVGNAALPVVSFVGSASIGSGTGSYAHASGKLALTGSIRRSSYALYEETSGKIRL
jgi:hypothetical protein